MRKILVIRSGGVGLCAAAQILIAEKGIDIVLVSDYPEGSKVNFPDGICEVVMSAEVAQEAFETLMDLEKQRKQFENPPITLTKPPMFEENLKPYFPNFTSPIDAIAKKGRKGKRRW